MSIVLPVHDQGDHLKRIVLGYSDALRSQSIDHEFVLVPNACTDDSVAIARRLSAELPSVRVVELHEGGWGRAVKAGLAAATGDMLCFTNLARTTAETLVLMALYARVYRGVVLKANRRIRESRRRRVASLLYNIECRALHDLAVWDVNGTPKIFPRSFDALCHLTRDDDLIDLEFNVICRREGYHVIEVPVIAAARHGGRSTTGYRSALRMYVGAFQLARSPDESA